MKISAIAATLVSTIAFGATPINGAGLRAADNVPFESELGVAERRVAEKPFGLIAKAPQTTCDPSDPGEVLAKIELIKRIVAWFFQVVPESARKDDKTLFLEETGRVLILYGAPAALALLIEEGDEDDDGLLGGMELVAIVVKFLKDKCASEVIGNYGGVFYNDCEPFDCLV